MHAFVLLILSCEETTLCLHWILQFAMALFWDFSWWAWGITRNGYLNVLIEFRDSLKFFLATTILIYMRKIVHKLFDYPSLGGLGLDEKSRDCKQRIDRFRSLDLNLSNMYKERDLYVSTTCVLAQMRDAVMHALSLLQRLSHTFFCELFGWTANCNRPF
jgi:hypothetical protein